MSYDPRVARALFRAEEELHLRHVEVLLEMGALAEAEQQLRTLAEIVSRPAAENALRRLRRKLAILRGEPDDGSSPLERATREYAETVALRLREVVGFPQAALQTRAALSEPELIDADALALLRSCDGNGSLSPLEQTARICRCVAGDPRPATLGRLAGLCKTLGNEPLRQAMERRFLDAFRKELCRPSFSDVLRVAAWRYLPLDQLRKLRFPSTELTIERTRRERAIGWALRGDYARAREIFESEDRPLDRRYLADLYLLEGNTARAIELYVHTYPVDASDTWTLLRLLAIHAEQRSFAIAELFRIYGVRERALDLLERALAASPDDLVLCKVLGELHAILGHQRRAHACAERAAVLGERAALQHAAGRVYTALAHGGGSEACGCVERVLVLRRPAAAPGQGGSLVETVVAGRPAAEGHAQMLAVFRVAKAYALAHFPEETRNLRDFDYELRIDGVVAPALGLAEVIAFLSVFLGRPVLEDVAFSGVVVPEADDHALLAAAEGAPQAVVGAYERNLRRMVLPEQNRAELADTLLVPAWVVGETVRFARDLDDAVTLAFGEGIRPH